MQADKIVKKILDDAEIKSQEILVDAENKANKILEDANNFCKSKEKETLKKVEEFKKKTNDKYSTLLKIEKNKLLLKYKQKALNDLKNKAIDFFATLNKEETLKIVENLVEKYGGREEKLLFCLKDISTDDILELNSVKKLDLQVEEANFKTEGIVLEGSTCDKNLLFSTLVYNAYENLESEINKILF